jgi:hypothetical protein
MSLEVTAMNSMQSIATTAAGLALALALAGPGHAQDLAQVVRMTDPVELAVRGHAPDAEVWKLVASPDPRPLAQRIAEREQAELAGVLPSDGQRSRSVQGTDFVWLRDTAVGSTSGNFSQACLAGSGTGFADAHLAVPSDRAPAFMDVWTRDASAAHNLEVALYATCSPAFAAGAPTQIELASVATTGSAGNAFEFVSINAPGQVTSTCTYFVRMIASGCADGTDLAVQKVRVVW